jgi:hypothetical protein
LYCTKEEKKTTTYMELVKRLLPFINSDKPLLSLVSKTMNKLVGERDWSSQEVMHILLNVPLQQGSRHVVTLEVHEGRTQLEFTNTTAGGRRSHSVALNSFIP